MFKVLFDILFSVISSIVNLVLTPINLLVATLLPDVSNLISTFNTVINTYIGNGVTWFFSILPPVCRNFVILYLTFLIAYYTTSISAHAIIKVYSIIKKVKIW